MHAYQRAFLEQRMLNSLAKQGNWIKLRKGEILKLWTTSDGFEEFARRIEALLKEKNGYV